jgi:hypothetical protein
MPRLSHIDRLLQHVHEPARKEQDAQEHERPQNPVHYWRMSLLIDSWRLSSALRFSSASNFSCATERARVAVVQSPIV